MGTVFEQGQELGRGDLDIFTEDSDGNPVNVYEISYSIYYVDSDNGAEVLIGPDTRTPVNPEVGEYYAAVRIPNSAVAGCYRIRWRVRETASSSQEGAVQEFGVVADVSGTADVYTTAVRDLINKLRIMTRDNCLGGDTLVEVDADGEIIQVSLEDLYEAIGDMPMQEAS